MPATRAIPLTIYYAFKQAESRATDGHRVDRLGDNARRGLLDAGFAVTGTWPMRTERAGASDDRRAMRLPPRSSSSAGRATPTHRSQRAASSCTRFEPSCRRRCAQLQHGNIAPVDLAQAAIGPGMAVFSRYAKVLEADGRR